MRKILFGILGVIALFSSCGSGSYDYYTFYIDATDQTARNIYADQEADTLGNVIATDSWTVKTTGDWITPGVTSYKVPGGYVTSQYIPLTFAENTTGAMRTAAVLVTDASSHTVGRNYIQIPHLNITSPVVSYTNASTYSGASFSLTDSAKVTADTIAVTLYASDLTVSTDADWVTLSTKNFSKNQYKKSLPVKIALSFPKNETGVDRTATITLLTSNGRKNTVALKQLGK